MGILDTRAAKAASLHDIRWRILLDECAVLRTGVENALDFQRISSVTGARVGPQILAAKEPKQRLVAALIDTKAPTAKRHESSSGALLSISVRLEDSSHGNGSYVAALRVGRRKGKIGRKRIQHTVRSIFPGNAAGWRVMALEQAI